MLRGADEFCEIDDALLELLAVDDNDNKEYVVRGSEARGSKPRVISQQVLEQVRHLAGSVPCVGGGGT